MNRADFDPSPLTAPVVKSDLRAFSRAQRAAGTGPSPAAGIVVGVVFLVIIALVVLPVFVGVIATFTTAVTQGGAGLGSLLPGLVLVAILAVTAFFGIRGLRSSGERAYRIATFARANGLSYVGRVDSPRLPGMIFGIGSSRQASYVVRGETPRFVEFANYRYTTGSGKNRTTHRWGYVAIRLDTPLPHIVLDAKGNNGLFGASNLPARFDADQRLSLEGDFDRYFTLSCPSGYERDALYLFTPDIMARFIDNAAALDVEIVDDWLFLYAKRDFSTTDPAVWAWLFDAVDALLDKLAQWGRWRDERLAGLKDAGAAPMDAVAPAASGAPSSAPPALLGPPPGVAAEGRRLRRGIPWASIVVVIVFVAFWLLSQSGSLWSSLLP